MQFTVNAKKLKLNRLAPCLASEDQTRAVAVADRSAAVVAEFAPSDSSAEDDEDAREPRARDDAKAKTRALDTMLEEFAARDAEREAKKVHEDHAEVARGAASDGAGDDFDRSRSTNVRVTGLSQDDDEITLAKMFETYGPIVAVKIWRAARGQSASASGFVCFGSRTSAERACADAKDDLSESGRNIVVEMSKPLRLPRRVVWPCDDEGFNFASTSADVLRGATISTPAATKEVSYEDDVVVAIPSDGERRRLIDIVATYVAEDGEVFEQELMRREGTSERFRFLYDRDSSEFTYYTWRVFAFAQGDSATSWRTDPFVMRVQGPRWIPPPIPHSSGDGSLAGRRGAKPPTRLTPKDAEAWDDILRHLTISRNDVCDAMEFAVERAECAGEIVDALASSLVSLEAPTSAVVARLYVASDILYNSAAPVKGVQAYRAHFIRVLPGVFQRMGARARGMSASNRDELANAARSVVSAWRDWFLFAEDFTSELEREFEAPIKRGS